MSGVLCYSKIHHLNGGRMDQGINITFHLSAQNQMPGWTSELLLTQDYFFPPKQHQKEKYLFWSTVGEEREMPNMSHSCGKVGPGVCHVK